MELDVAWMGLIIWRCRLLRLCGDEFLSVMRDLRRNVEALRMLPRCVCALRVRVVTARSCDNVPPFAWAGIPVVTREEFEYQSVISQYFIGLQIKKEEEESGLREGFT